MEPKNEVTMQQKKESDFKSEKNQQHVIQSLQIVKKATKRRKWKGWYFC